MLPVKTFSPGSFPVMVNGEAELWLGIAICQCAIGGSRMDWWGAVGRRDDHRTGGTGVYRSPIGARVPVRIKFHGTRADYISPEKPQSHISYRQLGLAPF